MFALNNCAKTSQCLTVGYDVTPVQQVAAELLCVAVMRRDVVFNPEGSKMREKAETRGGRALPPRCGHKY